MKTVKTTAINNYDGTWSIITSKGARILIDEEDLDKAMRYSWCVSKTGYAVANINGRVRRMHRYLLGIDDTSAPIVDHVNSDKLDNRRENLRICTQNENGKNLALKVTNTSGHAGVGILPNGRYRARIMVDRREIYLGHYDTYGEAVIVREEAERKYYGDFWPHGKNARTIAGVT